MTPNIKTIVEAQRKRNVLRATEPTTKNQNVQVRNASINQKITQQTNRCCAAQKRHLAHKHAQSKQKNAINNK